MTLSSGIDASLRPTPGNRNADHRAGTVWRPGSKRGPSFVPPMCTNPPSRPGALDYRKIPSLIDGERRFPSGQISMTSSAKSDVTIDKPPATTTVARQSARRRLGLSARR